MDNKNLGIRWLLAYPVYLQSLAAEGGEMKGEIDEVV
jgi:hypothetical protein